MSATLRGAIVFGGLILFLVACSLISFGLMPSAGSAVALPVIMVPGEPYDPTLPVESFRWTNTLTATVLASILTLAFAAFAWIGSKGWTKEVPGRFQSWVELLGGFMYGFAKQMGGKNARLLFPLVASIFVFLLATNWMKLLPGIESVGVMHCAEEGFSGYPAADFAGSFKLYVDAPLNAGFTATEEDYKHCKEFFHHGDVYLPEAAVLDTVITTLRNEESTLREELAAAGTDAAVIDTQVNALRLEMIDAAYHDPSLPLSADQLAAGAYPYIFVVTPYVRGATTDLNLTIGLAIVAVFAIQVFGVYSLGPSYFQKFINLRALGNLNKKPLGAVDFIVGIFEIVSELGKLVSLSFRLFGNMFAGGILLAVMAFLVALFLPMVFIGLEIIVTTIQALVFAILTLVFAAQAMEGHHGDDDHHDEHGEEHA
jgi:F-type H+-transporting ATPase subunit a